MNVARDAWRSPVRVGFSACLMCVVTAMSAAATGQKLAARVPSVGCKSDGQLGLVKAPSGESKVLPITAEVAGRLAYYQAKEGFGVLAPRGWYCFGTYGSNGETLYVSADPIRATDLLSTSWKGFGGPVVQASLESGDTSGRFGVARMIARVFPTHQEFMRSVIEERIEPASSFPSGPYPRDKLTYRSKELVEYETPPETEGLGTQSRLWKNAHPIRGVAILVGEAPDLAYLAVRLSPEMTDLAPVIIQQAEGMLRSLLRSEVCNSRCRLLIQLPLCGNGAPVLW
jgi:hypothetical protein